MAGFSGAPRPWTCALIPASPLDALPGWVWPRIVVLIVVMVGVASAILAGMSAGEAVMVVGGAGAVAGKVAARLLGPVRQSGWA